MQHCTTSLQEWFPLTCAGNFLLYKSTFHLLSLKILWSCSPEMANQLLSLADACSASPTWIELAVLNPNNCNSHCDLWFTSRNMRDLWHTKAEIPQMPPTGHFHTEKVRGGKRSAAATCWWCSSSSCWLGANTHPIQFSITLHMPPVREAWTGALQSRAEQPQDTWEPLLAKQEEGCSCPEAGEREHCFLLRESWRFVWLSWAT